MNKIILILIAVSLSGCAATKPDQYLNFGEIEHHDFNRKAQHYWVGANVAELKF